MGETPECSKEGMMPNAELKALVNDAEESFIFISEGSNAGPEEGVIDTCCIECTKSLFTYSEVSE